MNHHLTSGLQRATAWRDMVCAVTLTLVAVLLYSWIGLARFARGESGNYDLGIFTQAASSWADRGFPYADIKGQNLLGDHFSPVTIVYVPLYVVWPDPRSLIVTQAIALATCVTIVVFFGRSLGIRGARLAFLGGAAGLSLPLIAAASFQVHETALGAPIVAALAVSAVKKRFASTLGISLLALLVKEDMGLLVAGCGAAWGLMHRDWRQALTIAAAGALGFLFANATIIWVNPGHRSPYVHYLTGGSADSAAGSMDFIHLIARLAPIVLYVLLSGVHWSPIHLMAAPLLSWRILSSNELYWSVDLHYDVITAPVALTALAIALERNRAREVIVAELAAAVAIGWGMFKLVDSAQPWDWRGGHAAQREAATDLAETVPEGQIVVADQSLGPGLVPTHRVRMLSETHSATGRYVLLDLSRSTLAASKCAKVRFVEQHGSVRVRDDVHLVDLGTEQSIRLEPC